MTEEEAIRRIEEFALYHAIRELPNSALTVRAFEMAIEALEKQSKIESRIRRKHDKGCLCGGWVHTLFR